MSRPRDDRRAHSGGSTAGAAPTTTAGRDETTEGNEAASTPPASPSSWWRGPLARVNTSIESSARSSAAGFSRAAARFFLISRPFWTARQHAPGFQYYEEETQQQAPTPAAADTTDTGDGSSSSSSHDPLRIDLTATPATGPHFRHTTLNSPALIPRATRASSTGSNSGSRKKTILFASPSSSPYLSAISYPNMKRPQPPPVDLDANGKHKSSSSSSSSSQLQYHSHQLPEAPRTWRNLFGAYIRTYNFFHATPRRIAWSWSILMIVLLVACTMLHVQMSYCHKDMSTALGARDQDVFYATLWFYLFTVMMASPLLSISQYAKSQLSLHWRIYLTNKVLQQYFQHRNYYYLQASNGAGAGMPPPVPTAATATSAEPASKSSNGKSKKAKVVAVAAAPTSTADAPEKATSETAADAKSSSSAGKSGKGGKKKSKLSVDNPDQRIADDIRAFTRSSLTFVNEFLDEVFQVVAFAGILFSISPMLVAGLLVYALFGTYLATAVFGLQLIATNSKQSKLEADFRFSLVRVRTNAEAIAFYSGEHAELSYIYWRFSKITRNLSRMAGIQCNLAFFKHGYGFLTMLIPPFCLAPLYFNGEVELGVISQASMAFRQIFNSLNMVVSKMNELSKWRSGMERIWEIQQALEAQDQAAAAHVHLRKRSVEMESHEAERERAQREAAGVTSWTSSTSTALSAANQPPTIQVRPSQHLHIDHLMVCVQGDQSDEAAKGPDGESLPSSTPAMRVLVQNLTFFLPSLQNEELLQTMSPGGGGGQGGRGLLVMGRSGIGKSTLLRAIAGLWKNGRGSIYRPDLSALLFLPQRPYMILGTLRQQLLYPFCPQTSTGTTPSTSATEKEREKRKLSGGVETVVEDEEQSSAAAGNDAASSIPSPTPSYYGLRRRWPVASSSPSPGSAPGSPLSLSASSSSRFSPSPSPPPPSSAVDVRSEQAQEQGIPSDEDLEYILRLVNLGHLTRPRPGSGVSMTESGLDVLCDWSEVLSLGEAQRIAFARILIHQPAFCFCDEVTAALDAQNEESLYSALSTYAPKTCLVSVGHRPALLKHHSHVLHLQEHGKWDLLEINEENKEAIDAITTISITS
jgi:ABC-type uncharacterized transport system fused permease/ATPase subunit